MKKIIKKYEEIIRYIIVGGLTTVVSILSYYLFRYFKIDYMLATILSWIFAVLFAYITNKIFVFKKKSNNFNELLKELCSFFSCRLLSLLFEIIFMWLLVDMISINDYISKIIVQFIVLVLNYIFSKLFVFKK